MSRTPLPLDFKPGVVKNESPMSVPARFTDCLNVRFWRGKAQKWGGWMALPLDKVLAGIVRGCWAWGDQSARQWLAAGSSEKLYAIADSDWIVNDITPIITTVTENNPISTTNLSTSVRLTITGHGAEVGQYVNIATVAAVGSLTMTGNWKIATVVDANHVTVTAPSAATSTASGGGAGIVFTIEIAPGPVDPAEGFGWGGGTWGSGTWGTPRDVAAITFLPRIWSIKNFGRALIATPGGGGLYTWDPLTVPMVRAAIIPTAPTLCTGVVVTSDGIVIAYGTNQSGTRNLMEVWNAAQGDYTNWDITALAGNNGAPSRVRNLLEGTAIVYAEDLGVHVTLFWTNTALYALQYTGSQFVFNVQLAGRACGLIGAMAAVVVGSTAYWMGPDNFHVFNGSVLPIDGAEDISEWVFKQIKMTTKTVAWYNKRYNEIYWAFCTGDETEPSAYVSYSITGKFWTNGAIIRTGATAFRGSDARPILFGKDGVVYRHDDGLSANGAALPWHMVSEGIDLMRGEQLMEIDGYVADMERQTGDIGVDFTFYDHTPAGLVIEEESSIVVPAGAGLTDARGAGRELQLTFSGGESDPADDFRFGIPKLNTFPGASRE